MRIPLSDPPRNPKRRLLRILLVSACILGYYFEQNNFYGWHRLPHSEGELIADGITLIMVLLAILFA